MFLSLSTRWILLKTGIGLKIGKHKPIIKLFQGLTPDVTSGIRTGGLIAKIHYN